MLRQRLLAAGVLIPAAVAWAWLAPLPVYAAVGAGLVLVGAWEWAGLAGFEGGRARAAYAFVAMAAMAGAWWASQHRTLSSALLWAALGFWVLAAAELGRGRVQAPAEGLASEGLIVLAAAWFSMLVIRSDPGGAGFVLALLAVVWAADAGAYFAGKAWGRHRLAPRLSPGKTWEGLAGGLAAAALAGFAASFWSRQNFALMVPLAVVTAAASVVGDLVESRLKRAAGAKDSGHLIPGHGGLLDRIDSLTAAAPVFALGLRLLGSAR